MLTIVVTVAVSIIIRGVNKGQIIEKTIIPTTALVLTIAVVVVAAVVVAILFISQYLP